MRNKTLTAIALLISLVMMSAGICQAYSYSLNFSAGDVKSFITDPLSNDEHVWGLWALVAYPMLPCYKITSLYTDQNEWYVTHDTEWVDANGACFRAVPGSELAGNPAHPLHMISDQPDPLSIYITSYGGNTTMNVPNSTLFGFSFESDYKWDGSWKFLVDGSRYDKQVSGAATWDEDFWGGKDNGESFWDTRAAGGGLPGNTYGYVVHYPIPEPGSLVILGLGLLGVISYAKAKMSNKA